MNINKRLLRYVRTMRIYIIIIILLSLLTGLCIVLQARYITLVINGSFLARQPLAILRGTLLTLLIILIARASLIWINEVVTNFAATTVKKDLRQRLIGHLFKLGPMYVKGERSGEIVNTATEGVEALDAYFGLFFPQLCATIIIPIIILCVVFSIDILSGIILLVTLPVLPVFMILIGKQANAMTERRWRQLGLMSAHFLDVLQGMTTLKLFGRTKVQQKTVRQISDRFGAITMKVLRIAFISSLVMEMGATISTALIAVEIGIRLLYGNMPFIPAFFVLLLAPEFYQPLRALGSQFHASMNSSAGAERIFNIIETPAEKEESPEQTERATSKPDSIQRLEFNRVEYAYPVADSNKQKALKGISFELQRGQKVALVGPSGAGKSTVANLLLRFIEPDEGKICVDGATIQTMTARDWRELVAWQPQRPYLFNVSVADNIRMGRQDATIEEVIGAARQANIHQFIQTLPERYNTIIGERGARLSGGQAQRLSLARTFLKDAPLLILDEATSTQDSAGEEQILQAIDNMRADRMVLVIAHRLNTIRTADKIIVLQNGEIAASGTHETLLQESPLYQELIRAYADKEALA